MTLIDVRHVYKIYNEGDESEVRALSDISLKIDYGEFVAIVGASGSGKSTLMNMLGCLDIPTYGDYYIDGQDVAEMTDSELSKIRNKDIGFIFQSFNLIPALNAVENVELPLIYQGVSGAKRREAAVNALERVALVGRLKHKPFQMSGGQQQRVAIARAIATQPPIIMADEPTGDLDSKTGAHVVEILHGLHRDGITIILITHDNELAKTADRIIRISDGMLIYDSAVDGDNDPIYANSEAALVEADMEISNAAAAMEEEEEAADKAEFSAEIKAQIEKAEQQKEAGI